MSNPIEETEKRLHLAQEELKKLQPFSKGIILCGSLAYAPNLNVTHKSDIDLIAIVENLKSTINTTIDNKNEAMALRNRFFEGYCIKKQKNGIPISLHVLSKDCFDIICKCFVADIRVYRNQAKGGSYALHGFEGDEYNYWVKNIKLPDLHGVRTIVPVSFIHNDRYHLGIHRDKLLSHPRILYEEENFISRGLDKLWNIVTENMTDEAKRLYEKHNPARLSVLNALAKKDRFSPEAKQEIKNKERYYLSQH